MPKRETQSEVIREFDRQVRNLVQRGYPDIIGVTAGEFTRYIEPLEERIGELAARGEIWAREGRLPFVVVVKSDLVTTEMAMPLVDLNDKKGFIGMHPVEPGSFEPIKSLQIPDGMAYLLVDIDTGNETRNVTPDDALNIIEQKQRSPLTIDEGVALVTHYPEILRTHNCFSLLGSRCGDRRVTALWISKGRPRLGWCWAGNPHTWLGSASCGRRVGAEAGRSIP
ncbi:MAG TPA: DUF5701 family protein [Rubrobacteraceae bacterium]|nr:DUF5701 family protein [Rubrobacteraceae bacterium]